MVAVTIDGPLGKQHVGIFAIDKTRESLILRGVDDGPAVILPGKDGSGLENATGGLRFCGTNAGTAVQGRFATIALASIQIQQNHLMSQITKTGDGTGASAFGIARMPAGNDDFARFCRSHEGQRQSGRDQSTAREGHTSYLSGFCPSKAVGSGTGFDAASDLQIVQVDHGDGVCRTYGDKGAQTIRIHE